MKQTLLVFVLWIAFAVGQQIPFVHLDDQQQNVVISMKLKLKWDALWAQDATLEQVTAEEREEYIDEALIEVSSKMKRKHQVKTMSKFNILERIEEYVHVAYPDLKSAEEGQNSPTDEELKKIALQLLTTGVINTITVLRNGEEVDVFQIQAHEERAYENWKENQR